MLDRHPRLRQLRVLERYGTNMRAGNGRSGRMSVVVQLRASCPEKDRTHVQYMLLLVRSDEEWEALSPQEQDYAAIGRWWRELAQQGVLRDGRQLQPARTATTICWQNGKPVVTDGPFMEAKETIGGYGILDVADLDAAIQIARTWPGRGHKVEIRPVAPNE